MLTPRNIKSLVLLLLCAFAWSCSWADQLSAEAFALPAKYKNLALSPDGKQIAGLELSQDHEKGGYNLFVLDIDKKSAIHYMYIDHSELFVRWIRWANETTLLTSLVVNVEQSGTLFTRSRLVLIDTITGEYKDAFGQRSSGRSYFANQFQDGIIDFLPEDPDHIIAEIRDQPIRLNIKTQERTAIERLLRYQYNWITDAEHNLRISNSYNSTRELVTIWHKSIGDTHWKELWSFEPDTPDAKRPIAFDSDPNILFVGAYKDGRMAIYKTDLRDPDLPLELVYADEKYDMPMRLVRSQKSKRIVGVRSARNEGIIFWDSEFIAFQNGLDQALPDTNNHIIDISRDETKYLMLAESDTAPGIYYYGDREKKTLAPLVALYPDLKPDLMRPTKRFEYLSRDNLPIEAFVTMPDIGSEVLNVPAIVFPHGGPAGRDVASFNPWVQFFASRGYAVMQTNFRGSDGFGLEFSTMSQESWGSDIQADITDGTKWLINNFPVDKERVCIVGASFGGYAALMGVVKYQDLYKCGVSIAGISDLNEFLVSKRRFTSYFATKEEIGDRRSERIEQSPITYIKDLKRPILLIHGAEDRTVNVEQSRIMAKQLDEAGKDYDYLELEHAGHQFSRTPDRVDMFKAMDEFLSKHLALGE